MSVTHDHATLTRLADGRVLIAGGGDGNQGNARTAESLLFDPATDSITATGSLKHARYQHGAALLRDGRVLVVGGESAGSAEIYDPAVGTWADAAPPNGLRWSVGARSPLPVLADGRVLAVGFDTTRSAEIYDPSTNAWSAPMPLEHQTMVVADMGNGLVVKTGTGDSSSFFEAATGQWSAGPGMPVTFHWGVGVMLPGGDLLITGGANSSAQNFSLLLTTNPGTRDTTPPVITITSPTGSPVDFGTAVTADFSCSDADVAGQVASGIATCVAASQNTGPDGPKPVLSGAVLPNQSPGVMVLYVTATDIAGYTTNEYVQFSYGTNGHIEVTAADKTMTAGDAVPDLSYSATPDAVFITNPTCSTWADETSAPGNYPISCSGGDAGELFWITYVDGTLTIEAGETDGVPSAVENQVPSLGSSGDATGDGNADGIQDANQENVTSLPSYGSTDQWVTLASPIGTTLSNVSAVNMAELPQPPPSMTLPEGVTDFVVTGVPEVEPDQTISIYTESTVGLTGYAKYDNETGWAMLPAERVNIVDDHRVDITLTDGGIGDADDTVNGSIVDPGGLVFDRVGPAVNVLGIEAGRSYVLGATPTATCSATDDQSGTIGPCSGVTKGGNTAGVGDFTYRATATDRAGNTTTTSVAYRVIYRFDGFGSPINDPTLTAGAARSVFKAGSTIPVRIQLKNAAGTIVTPETAPLWGTPQKGSATSAAPNESVWSQPETSGITFDRAGDTWHFNWSTKEAEAGYTYRISVRLDDGTVRSVVIAIR